MASSIDIKKYVGAAGDAIAIVWQKLRGTTEAVGEKPPLGAQATAPAPAIAGISTGTLLLIGLAWMLLKRRR